MFFFLNRCFGFWKKWRNRPKKNQADCFCCLLPDRKQRSKNKVYVLRLMRKEAHFQTSDPIQGESWFLCFVGVVATITVLLPPVLGTVAHNAGKNEWMLKWFFIVVQLFQESFVTFMWWDILAVLGVLLSMNFHLWEEEPISLHCMYCYFGNWRDMVV